MLVTDFDYDLPQELIAQHPMEPRDHSRLLVVDKKTGEIEHKHFYDLVNYLKPGDVLVFNDTRVIPARLHGTGDLERERGAGRRNSASRPRRRAAGPSPLDNY